MATDLTSTEPKDTFGQLLHVDGGITASFKAVYDGDGTATVLELSTTAGRITDFTITGALVLSGLSTATVASTDKVLVQDVDDSDTLKTVTAQSIADLSTSGDSWGDVVDADIIPDADGTRDLGATGTRFAETYTDALDVTNNIVVGGTVDGRDLATDGTKLDGIESNATADQTTEEIQDAAWSAVSGGTQTLITVTYQDGTNDVDFVVDNDLSNYSNATSGFLTGITGEPLSDLSDVTITTIASGELLKWNGSAWINNTLAEAGIAASSHTHATSDVTSGTFADARIAESNVTQHEAALTITESQISDLAHITQEQVEDWAGAMWTGNTETGITITYQDADGTIDATVSDTTVAGDTGSTGITPGDTLTIAGGTNATTAMSGDTLTVNVDDAFLSNAGDVGTGVYDFGGATSLEIPNSATPTVNADGEIAVDTTVTDFSAGVMKYYSGEEMAVVAMPIAELTSPTDGHVVSYNGTNDEFELVAQSGGSGTSAGQALLFSLIRI